MAAMRAEQSGVAWPQEVGPTAMGPTAARPRDTGHMPPGAPAGLGLGLFIAVIGGLLVVRIAALAVNQTDLFFDEAQYWTWAKDPAWGYYSKPPVIAWVISLTTGLLGDTPFAIRLASPILHTLTAVFIYLAARQIYQNGAVAALAGILFALLPGVSFSSGIISTDVPLLTCFAAALWLFARYLAAPSILGASLLGLAIGSGLLAKYAMAYFFLGVIVWLVAAPIGRRAVLNIKFLPAIGVAAAMLAPNLWWNVANGGVTFSHTADNAKWGGQLFHPDKMGEFFAAQFGVFGPVLFAALLIIAWRALRSGRSPGTTQLEPLVTSRDAMLLSFALPVIAVVMTQALLSRAHANWAAVAYVPAVMVVAATLLRDRAVWARWATYVLHGAVVGALAAGLALAPRLQLPGAPFARVLGWETTLDKVSQFARSQAAASRPFAAIIADDRAVVAEARYYLR
ncbi:MAG: glycosyltransferase family 39 protein, partial [Pseudomonadota bacterium]